MVAKASRPFPPINEHLNWQWVDHPVVVNMWHKSHIQCCDLTSQKSWKMGSGPGSPFGLEDKSPCTSWMFHFWGFTDSPHPHKIIRNRRFGHNTGYFFLSLGMVATSLLSLGRPYGCYFSSFKKMFRLTELCTRAGPVQLCVRYSTCTLRMCMCEVANTVQDKRSEWIITLTTSHCLLLYN